MNIKKTITHIKQLVEPLLISQNVELIDIELKGSVNNQVLRIYVDVEGGINLDLCTTLSREISDVLDIEDIIPGKYRLEVSSPGVDRPLKTVADFRRNVGRSLRLNLLNGTVIEGKLSQIDGSDITLEINDSQMTYPIDQVKYGKLKIQWK